MGVSRSVAIVSGKGGVGKTTIAIALAHLFGERGVSTLLVDFDLGLANVDVQLGLAPRPDLLDLARGDAAIEAATRRDPESGLAVLCGRSGVRALADADRAGRERLMASALEAASRFDLALFDFPSGVDDWARALATQTDQLLLVATPEPAAITDAYVFLKLTPGAEGRCGLLLNQAADEAEAARAGQALSRSAARFLGHRPATVGAVRRDPMIWEAARRQYSLLRRHPNSPAADDLRRAASALGARLDLGDARGLGGNERQR